MALTVTTPALDAAFTNIQTKAAQLRTGSIAFKARIEGGNVLADEFIGYMRNLRVSWEAMQNNKSVAGLNDYAKTELNDPALDYVTEVAAVQTAAANCYNWIQNNMPKDANGYALIVKINNGAMEWRSIAPAGSAGLATLIGTLLTTLV